MANNKVTYGLDKVHIAFYDLSNPSQPAWETPTPIPGAVRWTPTAQGDISTFYADNGQYFVAAANNGYTGELEMALIPDTVLARMLGWTVDANGMVVEVADGAPEKFAILGQVKGDQKNRRFVYYDCQASRPNKERSTQGENITPATDVLSVTISPIEVGSKTIVRGELELSSTNASAFNAWFSAVTVPTYSSVSKTALASSIALAGSLTEATYTEDSWSAMQTAKTAATTVNSDSSASQAQVDAANSALIAAIAGLVVDA